MGQDYVADAWSERLHQKRQHYVEKYLTKFKDKHGYEDPCLRKKLEAEADRIYPMVDQSIVKERVERAIATFFITAALAIGVLFLWPLAVPLMAASAIPATAIAIFPIIFSAAIAAIATVATIGISVNYRVKGAMDSTRSVHEQGLQNDQLSGYDVSGVQQQNHGREAKGESLAGYVNGQAKNWRESIVPDNLEAVQFAR